MLNHIEKTRQKLLQEGKSIIHLSSGNPGEFGIFFPQTLLSNAFKNFEEHPKYEPEPKGTAGCREAIAEFYKRRGLRIKADDILITSGTSESYFHLFQLVAAPGDEILFPNPSYPLFEHIAKMAQVSLRYYQLDESKNWQVSKEEIEKNISAKTKAVVLVSPNNPTGGVLNGQTLKDILQLARKHRLAIISDEVFSEFMFEGKTFPRVAEIAAGPGSQDNDTRLRQYTPANIFTLNGLSKTFALPGLKLSWIIATGPGSPSYKEELELAIDTFLAANQISQAMGPDILQQGENFQREFHRRVEQSRNMAIRTLQKSPNIKFVSPEGGFYLFAEIKNFQGTDEDFVIRMMERTGIYVHPGYFYDYEKGLHVLISLLMEANSLQTVLDQFIEVTDLLCKSV